MAAVASLFERLKQRKPIEAPVDTGPKPAELPWPETAQRLLDWLQNRWGEPTISTRNICQFGPHLIRDRKSALANARILVEHGWLSPIRTHRSDRQVWRVGNRTG
jgi:hypothetical protein